MPALGAAELETVAQGPPGRRWLLLEAPLPGTGTLAGLQRAPASCALAASACSSAIPSARPRSSSAPGAVEGLLAAGDRLQVNASSLTGYHGAGARAAALDLVGAGYAAVIASDAHLPPRAPEPERRRRRPASHGTRAEQAEAMVAAAPRALLEHGIAPRRRLAA